MRFRSLLVALALLSVPTIASAQTAVFGPVVIQWDQAPVAGVGTLPSAFTFDLAVNGAAPVATAATCTAPVAPVTDWPCRTDAPLDLAAGTHSIVVIAKATINGTAYASGLSEPLVVVRTTITIEVPKNVRIAPAGGDE